MFTMRASMRSPRRRLLLLTVLLSVPVTPVLAQSVTTVGNTQDCDIVLPGTDTGPINEAMAAGTRVIRIAVPELTGSLVIRDNHFSIQAGFASCEEAERLFQTEEEPQGRTVIRGDDDRPTFDVQGSIANVSRETAPANRLAKPWSVQLTNFDVVDGRAGGILIDGPFDARIERFLIANNRADVGAGLRVRGALATVRVLDTVIDDNHAELDGGGVSCSASASVILANDVVVRRNSAQELGGGIDALNCRLEVRGRVEHNRAGSDGGGIHATTKSVVDLIGQGAPVVVAHNVADSNLDGDGSGGGIYVADRDTALRAESLHLMSNQAGFHGGGVAVDDGARASFRQMLEQHCGQPDCSLIEGNHAALADDEGEGAAVYAFNGTIELMQTTVRDHAGRRGEALIYIRGRNSILDVESSLVHSNGSGNLGSVFSVSNGNSAQLRFSTVAGNIARNQLIAVSDSAFSAELAVLMRSSSPTLWQVADSSIYARSVLTDSIEELAALPDDAFLHEVDAVTNAIFQAPAQGNYRLNNAAETRALAMNRVQGQVGSPRLTQDYVRQPRIQPIASNLGDIGPHEFPATDGETIFASGFESGSGIRFSDQLLGIFRHPRCVNCHTAVDDPELVNERFDHSGLGLATCSGGCHTGNATSDFNLDNWHAPRGLRLQGAFRRPALQPCEIQRATDSVVSGTPFVGRSSDSLGRSQRCVTQRRKLAACIRLCRCTELHRLCPTLV